MAVAVFGIIASLSSKEGTITFIGFLVLIVCLEKGLHFIEHAIEKSGLQLLFNKLKNELMLMGLISFAVLIYDIANSGKSFSSQAVTDAFEMSHVVFFFIATSFVIQAFFLVIYALTLGKRYLRSLRTNSEKLLEAYERMRDMKATDVEAKNQWWWFHEGNPLFPPYPAFRFDIEFRMLERLFIHQHNLSPDFNFANYVNELFKHYIAELGQHSAVSWLLIACLVSLNYFRVSVIDPAVAGSGCHKFLTLTRNTVPAESMSSGNSPSGYARTLAMSELSSGDPDSIVTGDCATYLLLYSYICASFLTLMGLVIYYCSVRYEKRILQCSLQSDGIDTHKNFRYSFINSLHLMIRRERMLCYVEKIDPGAGGLSTRHHHHHHHKRAILGGSEKSPVPKSLYDLLPEGESPSPRKGGGGGGGMRPMTVSVPMMTPDTRNQKGLDMAGLPLQNEPMSPLGRYPIPTPPLVTLDGLGGPEKSTERSSMRNKMIALPQGTLSRAQKEPYGSEKMGTAPLSASLQPEAADVFSRDLLGQGQMYGDVECGTFQPSADHNNNHPSLPHSTGTTTSTVTKTVPYKLVDSNNNNGDFEAYERCERKEIQMDSVEDPKTYRDDEMDTHYRYHRDEVTMERSHDPIMYRGDDVDVYDGYQRSEILMECEKFPPSQPGQTRIKAVDSFMIRTQTADFTALDFSPQRPRPQPSAPPPPPPVSELESTTHLKFENSQWQINDPRNRSASSAAGGGGAGGGITTYQPVDNNHHTMPKIQQLLNESAGAGDNHTDQPFAKEVNMNAIFTCGSPGLFFRSVDALLLFQCFFISIVFTQLIPLVSYGLVPLYNPGWIIGFILLILFNFYIIQLMLNKAVLLRAVYQLDTEVAGTVIEDAHELKISIEQLRIAVFDKLRDEEVPEAMWRPFLQAFFFRHSHNVDGTAYIYENDFHDLLLDLKLYKSPKAFDILWQAVDYDLSGSLDWEEIEQVFWPLEQATAEDPVVATIRVKMQSLLSKRKLPLEEWEPAVKELFSVFDKDGTGAINMEEFRSLLSALKIFMDPESICDAFQACNASHNGAISFDEFWQVVFPPLVRKCGLRDLINDDCCESNNCCVCACNNKSNGGRDGGCRGRNNVSCNNAKKCKC